MNREMVPHQLGDILVSVVPFWQTSQHNVGENRAWRTVFLQDKVNSKRGEKKAEATPAHCASFDKVINYFMLFDTENSS